MIKLKERVLGLSSSITGSLGFLGGYQVCHNICMSLASLLALIGFTVSGMPLFFLTTVAVPFWSAAVFLLLITALLKYKKMICLSNKVLLLNSGLIIAGIPFQSLEEFTYLFWITGGTLVIFSVGWHIYDRIYIKKNSIEN